MGIGIWILLGLIAGALGRVLLPGKERGGIVITTLLGIAGAFLGGWIGHFFGIGAVGGLTVPSILTATAGSMLLLLVFRIFS